MSPAKIAQPVLSVTSGTVGLGPVRVAVIPESPDTPVLPVTPVFPGVVALRTTEPPTGGATTLCTTMGGRVPMPGQVTDEEIATSSAEASRRVPRRRSRFQVPEM